MSQSYSIKSEIRGQLTTLHTASGETALQDAITQAGGWSYVNPYEAYFIVDDSSDNGFDVACIVLDERVFYPERKTP